MTVLPRRAPPGHCTTDGNTFDNMVLEAALAGGADVIVSGDRHLLALREFQGTRIFTARQFVARYARGEEEG